MEMKNETWESNADTDALLSKAGGGRVSRGVDRRHRLWRGMIPGQYALPDLTGLPPIMV